MHSKYFDTSTRALGRWIFIFKLIYARFLSVTMVPEDPEDMWHAYNLINEGDFVRAKTMRKVLYETPTGSIESQRKYMTITLYVSNVDFDIQGEMLRVKGNNRTELDDIKMNAFHTLEINLNRKFTITKSEWDSVALERVEIATDPALNCDLAAVIMQEGLANVCLVTNCMTIVKAKIDQGIPRKRKGNVSQHEKGLQRFFESVLQAIVRHVNFSVVKCVLIASPGFVKDQFTEYMYQQASRNDSMKVIMDNRGKFVLCHSSSGFKHSLKELLADPSVLNRLSDTKASSEVKALDAFYTMLQTEPAKAFYGPRHVEEASYAQAIETLLISDNLFRANSINERKRYVTLVDNVRENGGDVKIFSSLHVSGEQLSQLTGVAAILRFPMVELENLDSDSDEQ